MCSLLQVDFVDLCRDSAMSESELSPLRSLLPRLSVFAFLRVEKDLSGIKIASKKRGNFDTELKIIRIFAAQKRCE